MFTVTLWIISHWIFLHKLFKNKIKISNVSNSRSKNSESLYHANSVMYNIIVFFNIITTMRIFKYLSCNSRVHNYILSVTNKQLVLSNSKRNASTVIEDGPCFSPDSWIAFYHDVWQISSSMRNASELFYNKNSRKIIATRPVHIFFEVLNTSNT